MAALLADQTRAEAAFGRGKVQHTRQPQQARRRSSWDPSKPKAGGLPACNAVSEDFKAFMSGSPVHQLCIQSVGLQRRTVAS